MRPVTAAIDRALTAVERAAINRWHILGLLVLGLGLLTNGSDQAFELIGGNYTNVISATVSLLVLAEQKRAEERAAERHQALKSHVTTSTNSDSQEA